MNKTIELMIQYEKLLWSGIEITLVISLAAILLGLVLGILLAIMKIGRFKLLNKIASVYVEVMRGIPVMVILCMSYYGTALLGIRYPSVPMFGGACTSDRLIAAVIGLALNAAAQICEIVRGGIQSIDFGQTEAALSLGMSGKDTMFKVVLPQAVINIIPSLGNDFVNMIKTSSNVTIIGLADLMYVSNLIRGQSYRPFAPFVIVGAIYFVMTYSMSFLVKRYEKHITKSRQR
ncbi:MAG: amino acid ABC transporter permease [Lachnospiraceae bacterium]|nr:amino acid ABC transporter permease [Lachnospiraceae bacterium]